MNYKFNLGNVSFNMAGQGTVEVKDITVEVTDLNLKEIPGIIKETRKVFKDIKELIQEEAQAEAFKAAVTESFASEFNGVDTDGDRKGLEDFFRGLDQANAAHAGCFEEDCTCMNIAEIVGEAIAAQHPGAKVVPTSGGLAVAIPKNNTKF